MTVSHYINEHDSDIRAIKPGWYAVESNGKLSSGPFPTEEECLTRITQPSSKFRASPLKHQHELVVIRAFGGFGLWCRTHNTSARDCGFTQKMIDRCRRKNLSIDSTVWAETKGRPPKNYWPPKPKLQP
jgi:hypothetical protein